jgi:general secretion pathway protein G
MTRTLRLLTLFFGSAMAAIAAGEKADEKAAVVDATQERARVKRAEADIQAITAAVQVYKINAGDYPTEKQGLKALVEKPSEAPLPKRWVQVMKKVPVDPWGREYRLLVRMKNEKPVLIIASEGPDLEALNDDIEIPVEKPQPKK